MSFYATIEGELSYEKQEDFDKALETIQDCWINDKNIFIDEVGGEITDHSTIDFDNRVIQIPYYLYRNFAWVLGNIREYANGWYVWTTTDGDFQGGVWHTNEEKETVYPLFQRP